ncbi:cell wall-associated NlpC family hydrolase [Sinomonas atrocyanea]|uniref:C40 family peptidase n=1 Tax=Sinomonas atrocyanea TaxID=37927 RepID=UPI0027825817|nr:C40 family peptidase [Sinomonas atrocyanea]MDP9882613.1 cell wall-associated NlpC family hydrolase [Sinomonas atrocyanea]
MSITEAMGRVAQIQTTIAGFDPAAAQRPASSAAGAKGAASPGSTTATPQTAAAFAQALAGLLAPAPAAADAAAPLAAAGSTGGVTGDQVAAAAQKYVGVPYVWGGTNPATGMDCSGFVQRVYQDLGISLPRVVHDQMTQGTPVASLAEAKPGDLLIDFGGEHVAIYLGNGKAIDAPEPGKTIQVRDAWEKYTGLTAIRRIVPDGGVPGAGGIGAAGAAAAGSEPSGVAGLTASQLGYARTIVGEVRARGLPAQAAVNAVSTALQESSLKMYWNPKVAGSQALAPDPSAVGTDGYSVGLFQQQVNGSQFSWGSVADAMDPRASTRMFLDRLTALPGWQSMSVTAADQAVQRSAFPDAYAKWEPTARAVVAALYPGGV